MNLSIERLSVSLPRVPHAVDGVSFAVESGSAVGLLGESGAGKSLTALAIVGLAPGVVTGAVRWNGRNLLEGSDADWGRVRGCEIALMVQSAQQALMPYVRVREQIAAVAVRHQSLSRKAAQQMAIELLDEVQFPDPERRAQDYPHQLSGGMAQRAYLAMVLAAKPSLLIADEPTSALDSPVAAEVIALLSRLQRTRGLSLLLISHDLGILARICSHLVVIHDGRVVEASSTRELLAAPQTSYSRRLVGAARDLRL